MRTQPTPPAPLNQLPLLPTLTVDQARAVLEGISPTWRSWPGTCYCPTLRVTSCTGSPAAQRLWRQQSLLRAAACLVLGVAYRDVDKVLPKSPELPGRHERYTGNAGNQARAAAA